MHCKVSKTVHRVTGDGSPYVRPSGRLLPLAWVNATKALLQMFEPSLSVIPSTTCSSAQLLMHDFLNILQVSYILMKVLLHLVEPSASVPLTCFPSPLTPMAISSQRLYGAESDVILHNCTRSLLHAGKAWHAGHIAVRAAAGRASARTWMSLASTRNSSSLFRNSTTSTGRPLTCDSVLPSACMQIGPDQSFEPNKRWLPAQLSNCCSSLLDASQR